MFSLLLPGCGTTARTAGFLMAAAGGTAGMIGIAISSDGHPKGEPDVISRRGTPQTGVPIAMTGAIVFVAGLILGLASPSHAHADSDGAEVSSRSTDPPPREETKAGETPIDEVDEQE